MPRGGWNKGRAKVAGSGRRRGTPNKVNRLHREMLERLKVDSTDPMSFCISIMQSPEAPYEEKKWAVAQLFPYAHPKLSSIESRPGGKTHEQRLEDLMRMAQDDAE